MCNNSHFDCEQLFLKQTKFNEAEIAPPRQGLEPTTPRLQAELTVELRECYTLQFMIWDTGSGTKIFCLYSIRGL